jgi:hypothetical protein
MRVCGQAGWTGAWVLRERGGRLQTLMAIAQQGLRNSHAKSKTALFDTVAAPFQASDTGFLMVLLQRLLLIVDLLLVGSGLLLRSLVFCMTRHTTDYGTGSCRIADIVISNRTHGGTDRCAFN